MRAMDWYPPLFKSTRRIVELFVVEISTGLISFVLYFQAQNPSPLGSSTETPLNVSSLGCSLSRSHTGLGITYDRC